jgi:hypothetical protein
LTEAAPQRVYPLRRRFRHQRRIPRAEGPLFITDIARIAFSLLFHPELIAGM